MTQCIAMSFVIGRSSRKMLVEGLLNALPEDKMTGSVVLLPGNEPEKRKEYDNAWGNEIAKKYSISLFAEKASYKNGFSNEGTILYTPDSRPSNLTGPQLLSESKDIKEDYSKLTSLMNANSRSVRVGRRKFTIILCGENNLVKIQGKPFTADWRYPEFGMKKPGGILFNPIHYRMGNGGKLEARFRYLSSQDGGGYSHAIALANSYHGARGGWPKNGFALFSNGKRENVPLAATFGEFNGKPRAKAFVFDL